MLRKLLFWLEINHTQDIRQFQIFIKFELLRRKWRSKFIIMYTWFNKINVMNVLQCLINALFDVCAINCREKLTRIALDFIPLGIVTANVDRALATHHILSEIGGGGPPICFFIMVVKLPCCFYQNIDSSSPLFISDLVLMSKSYNI